MAGGDTYFAIGAAIALCLALTAALCCARGWLQWQKQRRAAERRRLLVRREGKDSGVQGSARLVQVVNPVQKRGKLGVRRGQQG